MDLKDGGVVRVVLDLCPALVVAGHSVTLLTCNAADVFVGPGVTIGAGTLVGARSNVFTDLPANVVAVGSPARAVRPRVFAANEESMPVPELAR